MWCRLSHLLDSLSSTSGTSLGSSLLAWTRTSLWYEIKSIGLSVECERALSRPAARQLRFSNIISCVHPTQLLFYQSYGKCLEKCFSMVRNCLVVSISQRTVWRCKVGFTKSENAKLSRCLFAARTSHASKYTVVRSRQSSTKSLPWLLPVSEYSLRRLDCHAQGKYAIRRKKRRRN
jgi:hypothetical protein